MLSELARRSIRKFVVDYSADRASRRLQVGRLVKAKSGRLPTAASLHAPPELRTPNTLDGTAAFGAIPNGSRVSRKLLTIHSRIDERFAPWSSEKYLIRGTVRGL